MAIKDIVKGICNITRCKYDVYTKEKTDEIVNGINATAGTKANSSDVYTKTEIDNKVTTLNNSIGTKANSSNVYAKGDYATITATVNTNSSSGVGSTKVSFPTGFNKDNCIILGVMYKCDTLYPNNYINGVVSTITKEVLVTLGKIDGSDNNNIYIQITDDEALSSYTFTVKVRLMKL